MLSACIESDSSLFSPYLLHKQLSDYINGNIFGFDSDIRY